VTNIVKAGRYQLLDELGRGAMGVVYRAHDPVIGREVAVKTMHLMTGDSNLTRPELIHRFQTEARAAGILTHPNIVVVYDAGEEDGLFFITMELVEGRSLHQLLESHQAFPMARAIRIMEQACSALDYAHKHNIVHRDIKPANLMLADDDTLKITDFGTAKILRFNMTQTAHVIGTPSYMSPEQIKGKPVDGRSDIFALGVILYEMVTGEKPFPGENITTVIFKIINEEPIPPRKLDPSIHPGLSAVITRALAKEPTARFQNCAEMLSTLRNYRTFGGNYEEDPQATLLASVSQPALGLRAPDGLSRTAPVWPAASKAAPVTAGGHTVYEPKKARLFWPSFWLAILLLGVIGATGYYVLPNARDVWNVVRENLSRPASPGGKASGNPSPANSAPTSDELVNSAPVTPPRPKSAAPPPPTATNKPKQAVNVTGAPAQKSSVDSGASPSRGATPSTALTIQPGTGGVSAPTSPNDGSAAPAAPNLAELKGRIEQRLADAGAANRVHVNHVGNSLILEGRLRPNEHQALINQLRQLPDWAVVSDDILYDDTPIATPMSPGGVPAGNSGISIASNPAQALIFVNGERQSSPTPAALSLAPGKYTIIIRKPNFDPYVTVMEVKQGQTAQVSATLTPRQQAEGGPIGFINVVSATPGDEIRLDGKPTGKRTPSLLEIPPGLHSVAVWHQGSLLLRKNVKIQANMIVQFDAGPK